MSTEFQFVTDTATLSVFDLAAIRHRIDDDADWWVYPLSVQLEAVNTGAAAFIDLGSDGRFSATLHEEPLAGAEVTVVLGFPSGTVFVGAGEETTSEGMEPDCTRGGVLLNLAPGTYQLRVGRASSSEINVSLTPCRDSPCNNVAEPLRLATTT